MSNPSNLPMAYSNPEPRPPAFSRSARLVRAAEMDIFQHKVRADAAVIKDAIDSHAAAQATWTSFDEEIEFFNDGLRLVGNSQTGQELLAQKLNMLVTINNRRIQQRFGR